jgi:hypothetical protein
MNRREVLEAAIECVTKTRQDQHGILRTHSP